MLNARCICSRKLYFAVFCLFYLSVTTMAPTEVAASAAETASTTPAQTAVSSARQERGENFILVSYVSSALKADSELYIHLKCCVIFTCLRGPTSMHITGGVCRE